MDKRKFEKKFMEEVELAKNKNINETLPLAECAFKLHEDLNNAISTTLEKYEKAEKITLPAFLICVLVIAPIGALITYLLVQ